MLHTKFQASEPSISEMKILNFSNPRAPDQGKYGPQEHHSNTFGTGPLDNASNQMSKP